MTPYLAYGGTFDPVHVGHLAVARAVRAAFGGPVHLLPAADPPHRERPGASAVQRAEMLSLAVAGEPGLFVDTRELRRAGPSYTADTLRELRADLGPDASLAWVVGADAFRGLPSWHDWPALLDLAHFVVVVRSGHDLGALPAILAQALAGRRASQPEDLAAVPAGRVLELAMPPHPASASVLRERLARGRAGGDWLPPAVAGYIARQGLYGAGPGSVGGV